MSGSGWRAVNTISCPTCGIAAYALDDDLRGRWNCDVCGYFDLPAGSAPWCFKNITDEISIGEVRPGAGVVFADANGHVIFPQEYAGRIVRAINGIERLLLALEACAGPEGTISPGLGAGPELDELNKAFSRARRS